MRRVLKPDAYRRAQLAREHAYERRDARATSRDAAGSVRSVSGRQRAKVLRVIVEAGSKGLTDEQVCAILDLNPSSARPRRLELLDAGLIQEAGKTRLTKSGRRAIVWIATDNGKATV